MFRRRAVPLLIFACLLVTADFPAWAADPDFRFTLDFGYRWKIGFRGSEDLYRSQLDYGEGPKLFGGEIRLSSLPEDGRFFDEIEFRMDSWGGEPFNTARFRLEKLGKYEIQFNYRNSRYFSSIPYFANPLFEAGNLESQHRFNMWQRSWEIRADFLKGSFASPFVSYNRSTRRGPSVTTLAGDGDEFVLNVENDTTTDDVSGGVHLNWERMTLTLEQGFRWYSDKTTFEGGPQDGNSDRPVLGRPITLENYSGQRDVDGLIPFSNASLVARPWDALVVRGNVGYGIGSYDSLFQEQSAGSFFRFPELAIFYGGLSGSYTGEAKRPNLLADVSAEWSPHHRFRVIEHFRTRRLHTSGGLQNGLTYTDVESALGRPVPDPLQTESALSTYASTTFDRQQAEAQFDVTPRLTLRGGHRFERKRYQSVREFGWDRNTFLLGATYRFSKGNRISAEYELASTDDIIQRTDLKSFYRLRVLGQLRPLPSLHLQGRMLLFNNDNDQEDLDYEARDRDYQLRFEWNPLDWFSFSGGYERTNFRSSILFTVPQTLQPDTSVYQEKGDYGDAYVTIGLPRRGSLSLGYSVWGTVGTFPLTYHRPLAILEIPLGERVVAYSRWNFYGYNEKFNFQPQDYQTHLLVVGVRLLFDRPGEPSP